MPGQSTRKVDGGRIAGPAEITNCVELIMRFQLVNQKIATVRAYGTHEGTFVSSTAMANQLFAAISPHWTTRLVPFMNASVVFLGISIRDMTSKLNPEYRSTTAAVPGTGLNPSMPPDVALVLTGQATERGRGAKGRMYFCGWGTQADTGSGQASSTAVTALTSFGTDLRTELNAVALTSAVAKPARQEYIGLTGALHPARAAHAAQVTAWVCQDAEWDTQRRRGV